MSLEPSPSEVEEAAGRLGTLIGWLTYYGYHRAVLGKTHREALEEVVAIAREITAEGLSHIPGESKRYALIILALHHGHCSWSDIQSYIKAKAAPLASSSLWRALQTLIDWGCVVKEDSCYKLVDPLLPDGAKLLM